MTFLIFTGHSRVVASLQCVLVLVRPATLLIFAKAPLAVSSLPTTTGHTSNKHSSNGALTHTLCRYNTLQYIPLQYSHIEQLDSDRGEVETKLRRPPGTLVKTDTNTCQ